MKRRRAPTGALVRDVAAPSAVTYSDVESVADLPRGYALRRDDGSTSMANSRDDLAGRSFFVEQARGTLREHASAGVLPSLRQERAMHIVRSAHRAAFARAYRPKLEARSPVRVERRPRERRATRRAVVRVGSSRDGPSRSADDDPHELSRRLREGVAG
jgi:hypothetical protein